MADQHAAIHTSNTFATAMQSNATLSQIIASIFDKRSATWQRENPSSAAQALKDIAVELRKQHPELTEISVDYSGGGDSGYVEGTAFFGVDADNNRIQLDEKSFGNLDLEKAIDELAWDLAYGQNPGFEINEGGQGVVRVLFEDDEWTVHLHHEENLVHVDEYEYTF